MQKVSASIAILGACVCLLLSGCFSAPTGPLVSVPKDTARTCRSHCSQLGLKLSAVVIIMSSAGCVCEPRGAVSQSRRGASAAVGGAIIHAARQEEQRRKK